MDTSLLKEYQITLTSGDYYLLARDSMEAAYAALELSKDRDAMLLNVQLTPEW